MNNAANNIDAQGRSLRDLLKERHYKVGYFQREYKWKRDNIEDLINDLERSFWGNFDASHSQADVANYSKYYMGPVVLFQEGTEFSIVDGQQRLTSFTLIMIFLNHLQQDILGLKSKLDDYIYSNYYGNESYNLNIPARVGILDKLFRKKIIIESDLINESSITLLERYHDIEELFPVTLKHKETLPLFINWITEKLVFIEIMTQTSESAYTIFETMNDRGLKITPTEMLKSFILSKAEDEENIKELDILWKDKIGILKSYSNEEDQDFFKAWLRAKYAVTIRTTEKGAMNEDFEKIGTRFHNWVQDNHTRLLLLKTKDDFYNFIQSDFQFYSDVYLYLLRLIGKEELPESPLKLLSYKGISLSLSQPLIMSPVQKIDQDEIIKRKIEITIKYIDAFGVYRLLLNEPITHNSIRNAIYLKIKEIRNLDAEKLYSKLNEEINEYKLKFLNDTSYVPYDSSYAKYVLARLYKHFHSELMFENIYFLRRRDSFALYQFFTYNDVEQEVHNIPKGLKDIFIDNLCSYCVAPRDFVMAAEKLPLTKRIPFLIKNKCLVEFSNENEFNKNDIKNFFLTRNKKMMEQIITVWKV